MGVFCGCERLSMLGTTQVCDAVEFYWIISRLLVIMLWVTVHISLKAQFCFSWGMERLVRNTKTLQDWTWREFFLWSVSLCMLKAKFCWWVLLWSINWFSSWDGVVWSIEIGELQPLRGNKERAGNRVGEKSSPRPVGSICWKPYCMSVIMSSWWGNRLRELGLISQENRGRPYTRDLEQDFSQGQDKGNGFELRGQV